ncbi:MAG: sodium-dependent transporter [Gammaproteobacteria bacterium]|nr:sodium-dependent transporter [Gammaproteobacteria bacterium]MBQ0838687.1 sodium-dependent transporter [Gammaproteobacteria bacterium]
MSSERGQFSSRFGFISAATGSAVGLGNIWGFPTQTASHGGGAFVLVYLILAFLLAYPALMAELIIGRHTRHNMVGALPQLTQRPALQVIGRATGLYGVLIASLILSFYAIVAAWLMAQVPAAVANIGGQQPAASWFTQSSLLRDSLFCVLFLALTAAIVARGVKDGIERWSSRLMPALLLLILGLTAVVLTLPGAMEGLRLYLVPDFSLIAHPSLLTSAMGQAFFSLSLGVGTMLVYGSYMSKTDNLPLTGAYVALIDSGIAFLAGLLIIPAMFVAHQQGIEIYSADNTLIAGPDLILKTLPTLFNSLGLSGALIGLVFFLLLSIAALTSSISMLEVPVTYALEQFTISRSRATWLIASGIFAISLLILFNFDELFGSVINITTKYSQPLLGAMLCLFAGWALHRDKLLSEISAGYSAAEQGLFWKIWPSYIRFVCPVLVIIIFVQNVRT